MLGNTSEATGATNAYVRAKVNVAYGYGLSGAGVKIGIVDTGFNIVDGKAQHSEFNAAGKVVALTSSPPIASDAHGPNVAGLALAQRDGSPMQGIAYNATLYLGDTQQTDIGIKSVFDEYTQNRVNVSSNSYGINVNGTEASPWKPVATSTSNGLEVTAKNAIAYRDANGLTSTQAIANIQGGTAAGWSATIASMKAFQDQGGTIVWANSNYGPNEIANGSKGLDDADLNSAFPLLAPELRPAWITVVNATSRGLAVQEFGQGYVDAAKAIENNIVLASANCGLAANFCLSHDGVASYSASNTGNTSYTTQTGTSQATPQVAGMMALLREAFPTASAADLTARLLYTANNTFFTTNTTVSKISTASYTNANGTITHLVSDIWGHGFPDLERALQPVGATTTATARDKVIPTSAISGSLQLSSAFGRGTSGVANATFLYNDQLNGVFAGSLGSFVASAQDTRLATAFGERMIDEAMTTTELPAQGLRLSFGRAIVPTDRGDRARIGTVFALSQRFGPNANVAMGFGFSPDSSIGFAPRHASVRGASVTDRAMGIPYLAMTGGRRQSWFSTGFATAALRSSVTLFSNRQGHSRVDQLRANDPTMPGRSDGMVADMVLDLAGFPQIDISAGMVREQDSFLGSRATSSYLRSSATSRFGRIAMLLPLGHGFALQGNYVTAVSQLGMNGNGVFAGISAVRSEAAAFNLIADEVVHKGSRLTLGVSQPLRVAAGRASLNLPTKVLINGPGDYAYIFEKDGVRLAPSGRELDYVIEYSQALLRGASINLTGMAMSHPGHDASARLGVAAMGGVRLPF